MAAAPVGSADSQFSPFVQVKLVALHPDAKIKWLCVILSGVELLRAAERTKARAVCGDAGSLNEFCWLVTVLLLFCFDKSKFTRGKLLVIV